MTKSEKCSTTQIGRVVIFKGDIEKRVYPEELDNYLKLGYKKGHKYSPKRVEKFKGITPPYTFEKGHIPWNKGIKAEDNPKLKEALDKAHNAVKGSIPWNKGLTRETDPRVGIICNKAWLTKKKNNSCNTSKPEELLYEQLLKEHKNKTIYRNYKCDRYPFNCDFYILEDDLFIELNAHWTHGGRPFDPNDFSCIKQLEIWEEKAKQSEYFKSAINTWTIRDPLKAKTAKDNNLNYWVIY